MIQIFPEWVVTRAWNEKMGKKSWTIVPKLDPLIFDKSVHNELHLLESRYKCSLLFKKCMYIHMVYNEYKSLYLELQICTQTWNNYCPFEELRPDNMMIDHRDFVFHILVSLQKLGIANDVFKGFSQAKVL